MTQDGGAVEIDLDAHGLTEEDAEKMISDVVYFFLVEDQKKSLINRPDIMNKCGVNKKARAVQEYVMMKAKDKLMNIMGIRVSIVKKAFSFSVYILFLKKKKETNVKRPATFFCHFC